MKLPLPRTLFARLMLIWLLGIALVLAISFALFLGERDRFDRGVLFEGIAREIAATVEMLEQMSPAERQQTAEQGGRRRLRIALAPPPPDTRPLPERFSLVQIVASALPEHRVALLVPSNRGDERHPHHGRLFAALQLSDGTPLTIRVQAPPVPPASDGPTPPARALAALLALITGVTLLAWIAVRLATRPLSRLADAARALGEDPERAPMATDRGSAEVRQAASAFNQMQRRIREHVRERTRILAAISHDLQTPITRLRLRAEQIDDDALRERIQSDLDAMQALAREGLDYARSLDANRPSRNVDLDALLDTLREDALDMGWAVSLRGQAGAPCLAEPVALRRAMWNLVGNGIKFGERVEITVERRPEGFMIAIRDHGPGLPEDELEKVFEPFYRVEGSRNRETGGTGLGLTIARNLLRAQGGEVRLRNAPGGGLEACVSLPAPPRTHAADVRSGAQPRQTP